MPAPKAATTRAQTDPPELVELRDRVAELEAELVRATTVTDPGGRLVAALAAAQGAFPPIAKTKTAQVRSDKGNYSYSYADLADVLAVVRPYLAAQGLAIVQRTQYLANGSLMLVTELLHVDGAKVVSEVVIDAAPKAPQAFGGALTYLRRYELVTLLGIQADEDADAHNVATPDDRRDTPTIPVAAIAASDELKRITLAELTDALGDRDVAKQALVVAAGMTDGTLVNAAAGAARAIAAQIIAANARRGQDATAEAGDPPAPDPTSVDELGSADVAERPDPGTVPMPELPQDPAVAFGVLRAAGCSCPDPLASKTEHGELDDACILNGHGIPF